MRSVAALFLSMGWTHQAVGFLERVVALEPFLPQPHIDLALALFLAAKDVTTNANELHVQALRSASLLGSVLTKKWAGDQKGARLAAIYWLSWIDLYITSQQLPSVWPSSIPEYMRLRQTCSPKAIVTLQWDLPVARLELVVESPTGEVLTSARVPGSGPMICFLLDAAESGSYTVTAMNESGGDHFCTVSAFVCVNPCKWGSGEPQQEQTLFMSTPMNLSSSDREILGSFEL